MIPVSERRPFDEPPPRKKTTWIVFGALAGILTAGSLWFFIEPSPPSAMIRYQVVQGASAHLIARELHQQGLLRHPWTFLIWVKWHPHAIIRPGVYELSRRDTGLQILQKFIQGPPLVRVTFPEGWTSRQMAAALEARGVTSAEEFLSLADQKKLEGFLFPDTYFFEQSTPAERVVARLLERFKQKEPSDLNERARAMKLTPRQVVTLASLVEKEARIPEERPIIAGVFLNRLRKRWLLESCATVRYALGDWKSHLTYKNLQVDSPYNTYRHRGFPPGPICNPGEAAIRAVLHPAPTDMMFFVAEGQGTHRFSRYYKEHLTAQKHKRAASSERRASDVKATLK